MSTGLNCPVCRADEHRLLGHSMRDYIQWWTCEVCGHEWVRWPKHHPYYAWAKSAMDNFQQTKTEVAE